MTNPTRQEIIDAHDSLENLGHMAWNGAEFCGDTEDTAVSYTHLTLPTILRV